EKQHNEDGRYQRNCTHDHLLRSEVGWGARPGKPEDQDDAQQPAERDTACQDHHLALNHRSLAKFLYPFSPSDSSACTHLPSPKVRKITQRGALLSGCFAGFGGPRFSQAARSATTASSRGKPAMVTRSLPSAVVSTAP